ncbi:MAG: tripartite tricarboxylate transporter permease, partial [Candidatus Woesearchaeota archaeon]
MLQILLGIGAGILLGTATIIPGLHINLISALMIANAGILSPELSAVAIFVMAITATFMDFLPSIFLGAPESETAMSVLPAHRLLLKGKGYEAAFLTTMGSLFGLCSAAILFPAAIFIYPLVFKQTDGIMHWLLLAALLLFIWRENSWRKKFSAIIIIILAGSLGFIALDKLEEPLLPLFSGLFGMSTIASSIASKADIPMQRISAVKMPKLWLKNSAIGAFFGAIINIFPAIGPAQAAATAGLFTTSSKKGYLLTVSAVNTAAMALSLAALYSINRGRNGAIEALGSFAEININTALTLIGAALLAVSIAIPLKMLLAKTAAKLVTKIPYRSLCILTMCIIIAAVTIISGWKGLLVLATGTA